MINVLLIFSLNINLLYWWCTCDQQIIMNRQAPLFFMVLGPQIRRSGWIMLIIY